MATRFCCQSIVKCTRRSVSINQLLPFKLPFKVFFRQHRLSSVYVWYQSPSSTNNTILQEKLHKKMMSLLATKMRPPTKKAFHRTVMSWLGKWTWDHQRSVCHLPIVLIWDVTSKSLCLHSDLRASVLVPAVYLISRPWRLRAFRNESPSPRCDWR